MEGILGAVRAWGRGGEWGGIRRGCLEVGALKVRCEAE